MSNNFKNNLKSIGKPEYTDGINWFTLASEDWVKNNATGYICVVATVSNLVGTYNSTTNTLTNFDSVKSALVIDDVSVNVNDYILVKNQNTNSQNGIYKVTNVGDNIVDWVLTRIDDFSTPINMIRGTIVNIIGGTINTLTSWMLTTVVTEVGISDVLFASFNNKNSSLLGTTNQIIVSVNNGVATLSLAENIILPGNAGATIPAGTTAQRPTTPVIGTIRFNTSL